ncbi:MAG: glycoside hydrolase family 3 C-terminal domain-containing protein [Bifidobacteriaceae bacterium]|nr:glycoside hydrolase family 3 C-terminal domain-containing protein [Bifidobacteriaceae bacterium]
MRKHLATLAAFAVAGAILVPAPAHALMHPGTVGLAQRAATEGIVLLQNDDGALPLTPERPVSVFGRVQINYFPVGYGSGGDVKYTYYTNLLTGLRRNPGIAVNETLAKVYEKWCASHKPDDGGWAQWPLSYPEMPLTNEVVGQAAAVSETAVVVIGRSAGESREAMLSKGSFYLTDAEEAMLAKVNAAFPKVVVLLNVGNVIDMQWASKYNHIKSLLYVWQGGQESGTAIASVLSGDVSPSGKLPDTIAYTYADYPTVGNFGQSEATKYQEDIFVGYRYFETFARDRVAYPFGYGLSYTTFDIATTSVVTTRDAVKVSVTVTNTGSRPGKEVVQVYYGAPQGLLGKAAKSLGAYAKTNTLAPGAKENITITLTASNLASYDDAGKTGHKSAWVLEAGDYPIYVGNSVRSAAEQGVFQVPALRVTEQLTETAAAKTAFDRFHAAAGPAGDVLLTKDDPVPTTTAAAVKARLDAVIDALPDNSTFNLETWDHTGTPPIQLIDVYEDPSLMDAFIDQLSMEEMAYLTSGPGTMDPPYSVLGSAGVYAGYTLALQKYGIPPLTLNDGPSGIRISESATLLPIGTLLASTWNDALVEELYAGVGAEMILNGTSAILAPGMNIHRDPLCGRNFEYFSEDPLLAGQMGAAFTRGVQSQGVGATPKHYAANNQETNRGANDSQISERALREIYLKAFEITVKAAEPLNVMTSYNRINGQYNNMHWQLVTQILRNEWGFTGVVMTDWGGVSGNDESGLPGEAGRVRSGVDVVESGSAYAGMSFCFPGWGCFTLPGLDDIVKSIDGTTPPPSADVRPLKLAELRTTVERMLNVTLKSEVFRTAHHLPTYSYQSGEYEPADRVFTATQPAQSKAVADMVYVGGQALAGFTPNNLDYSVFTTQWSSLPEVTAIGPANATLQVTQATAARPVATVYVHAADGAESRYRIAFTDSASRPLFHAADISADLAGITIAGFEIPTFYRSTYDYMVWVPNANPVVGAIAPEGVTYTTSRDGNLVTIRSESATQAREYRVTLGVIDPTQMPRSDAFSSGALDPAVWSVGGQTPALTVRPGGVSIVSEAAEWSETDQADLKNYLSQPAQGNWTAEVEIGYDTLPVGPGAAIGLMVYEDLDTYVKLQLEGHTAVAADTTETNGTQFLVRSSVTGSPSSDTAAPVNAMVYDFFTGQFVLSNPLAPTDDSFSLRIVKSGESYTFAVKTSTGAWTGIGGTQTAAMSNPRLGFFATNDPGADSVTATLSSFTITGASPAEFPTALTTPISSTAPTTLFADTRFAERGGFSATSDPQAAGHLQFNGGEFNNALYNIDVAEAGYYAISPRAFSEVGTNSKWTFFVQVDGEDWASWGGVGGTGTAPPYSWTDLAAKIVYLTPGLHKLRLHCWTTTGFNVSLFTVTPDGTNRDGILSAISQAKNTPAAPYTAASWKALTNALAAANAAFADALSTQAQVDTAAAALASAQAALVLKPPSTPSILVPPSVAFSGDTAQFGTVATANAGAWSAAPDRLTYQWLRNGEPIAGATRSTYATGVDDVGTKLSLRVTVSVLGQEEGVFTTGPVVIAPASAPRATVAPSFSAAPVVGKALTVTAGQWTPTADSVSYRWFVGGVEAPGQASGSYTPTAGDAGKVVSVIVSARRAGHEVGTVEVKAPVTAAAPTPSATPTPTVTVTAPPEQPSVTPKSGDPLVFSGPARTGTLLSTAGLVPATATATYQWTRNGVAIAGANGPTYALTPDDAGTTVLAAITLTYPDGTTSVIHSGSVSAPKLTATVTAKLVKKAVKAGAKAKVKVTVKVPGVSAPTGKISVKYGKKTKVYSLTAAKKGAVTLALPKIAAKGKYAVKVTYRGTDQIAQKAAKSVRLTVK